MLRAGVLAGRPYPIPETDMMNKLPAALIALALCTGSGAVRAEVVYDNTSTDTLFTAVYSVGPYSLIGDRVALGGGDRLLNAASVQFYNLGSAGRFTASLAFWRVGAPVGAAIGSPYVLPGIAIGEAESLTITFNGLSLVVPDELVFTLAVSAVTPGADLGLNIFNPTGPSIGNSDLTRFIVQDTNGFSAILAATPDTGNLYLQLDATPVPLPGALLAMASGLLVLGWRARRGALTARHDRSQSA